MSGDQHTVLGADQIGFDVVCALANGQHISGQGVFRSQCAGTPVGKELDFVVPQSLRGLRDLGLRS